MRASKSRHSSYVNRKLTLHPVYSPKLSLGNSFCSRCERSDSCKLRVLPLAVVKWLCLRALDAAACRQDSKWNCRSSRSYLDARSTSLDRATNRANQRSRRMETADFVTIHPLTATTIASGSTATIAKTPDPGRRNATEPNPENGEARELA